MAPESLTSAAGSFSRYSRSLSPVIRSTRCPCGPGCLLDFVSAVQGSLGRYRFHSSRRALEQNPREADHPHHNLIPFFWRQPVPLCLRCSGLETRSWYRFVKEIVSVEWSRHFSNLSKMICPSWVRHNEGEKGSATENCLESPRVRSSHKRVRQDTR